MAEPKEIIFRQLLNGWTAYIRIDPYNRTGRGVLETFYAETFEKAASAAAARIERHDRENSNV